MQDITLSNSKIKEYEQLFTSLKTNSTPILTIGLPPVSKLSLQLHYILKQARPVLILTDDQIATKRLSDDLAAFSERKF